MTAEVADQFHASGSLERKVGHGEVGVDDIELTSINLTSVFIPETYAAVELDQSR